MEIILTILKVIGLVLLVILALAFLILIIPIFYETEVNTTSKATAYDVKVKSILSIWTVSVQNGFSELVIFGFIKIKLKSHDKKEDKDEEKEKEIPECDRIPENASILRKLKLKAYILERKVKEKTYKFRNTIKQVNEYKYKMELLKKTIEYVEKILKSLKPKKSYIAVTFGTGNSELTGKLMAMAAPWLGKHPKLTVIPDFSKSCLNLDVYASGHIMPAKLLVIFLKYWNEEAVKSLRALKKGAKHE